MSSSIGQFHLLGEFVVYGTRTGRFTSMKPHIEEIDKGTRMILEITLEHIKNALSALSPYTRATMREELEKALRDTAVDYHRTDTQEASNLLATESASIAVMISMIEEVDKEFKEISDG
jgi:hypothetical protein